MPVFPLWRQVLFALVCMCNMWENYAPTFFKCAWRMHLNGWRYANTWEKNCATEPRRRVRREGSEVGKDSTLEERVSYIVCTILLLHVAVDWRNINSIAMYAVNKLHSMYLASLHGYINAIQSAYTCLYRAKNVNFQTSHTLTHVWQSLMIEDENITYGSHYLQVNKSSIYSACKF